MREKLLVVIAALAAFGLTSAGSFHFDDYALFSDPVITAPSGGYEVWRPMQTRPLTYFSYWLNYQAGGAGALGFHLVDLALHLASSLMALAVFRQLLPAPAALIAALLFAVHPIQTESVAYVFARGTVIATLLCLVALWYWLRGKSWIAVLFFAAALLAKEECAAFPLLVIALWMSRSRERRQLAPIATMLLLSLAAGLRVIYVASTLRGSGAALQSGVSPLEYFSVQGAAIVRYLAMLIVPWGYTVDTELAPSPVWRAIAWLIVAGAVLTAARWGTDLRAGFWFIAGLILLTPSSTIFPAADLAADRRMYLPMVAFSACAALLVYRWPRPALAFIFVALVTVSIRYSTIWLSERSLWSEAVARAPDKVRPRIQLSRALQPEAALTVLDEAQRIAPRNPVVWAEQGKVFLDLGRPAEALAAFGRALALSPGDANALNNRGAALQALGQADAARQDFERSLRADPCLFNARLNLERLGITPPPANCRFTPDQQAQLRTALNSDITPRPWRKIRGNEGLYYRHGLCGPHNRSLSRFSRPQSHVY